MTDDPSGPQIGGYRSVVESDDVSEAHGLKSDPTALINRATNGDRSALIDAIGDPRICVEVLDALVEAAETDDELFDLARFVVADERLRPIEKLVSLCLERWQASPQRLSVAMLLHLASRSDQAHVFERTVETISRMFLARRLGAVSAVALCSLFESEFWLLSAGTRSSGAGFVLKQTISEWRKQLTGES